MSLLAVHWIQISSFTLGISALILLIVFRSRVVTWAKPILDFTHKHPQISRVLHASLEAIPDLAYVLLAIAGLTYLMPGIIKKLEENRQLRLTAVAVFVGFGLVAVIVNAISRSEQENRQAQDRRKIDDLGGQVHDTLQFLVQSKGVPNEIERRKHILDTLRSEYILAHPEESAAMIAGNTNPPSEWVNKRLQELGERWPYVPPTAPTSSQVPRSYVIWVDNPRFAGGQREDDPPSVSQPIEFNIYYKQSGPNQVDVIQAARWFYLESDTSTKTQRAVVEDFMHRLHEEPNRSEPVTLAPGANSSFFSAHALDTNGQLHLTTQGDLDNLRNGTAIIFVLSSIVYRDPSNNPRKEHHLSRCVYLQPPANPPGVWHYCAAGFNQSD
jgi:hypothetical protein